MKRLTAKKLEQLRFALWYVLESEDIAAGERRALNEQVELIRDMYRRLTGKELV